MIVKTDLSQRYLELLKKSLVDELYIENEARLIMMLFYLLNKFEVSLASLPNIYDVEGNRELMQTLALTKSTGNTIFLPKLNPDGSTSPSDSMRNFTELSHTMIGKKRLDNIQYCMETVLTEGIRGDMIETGIWRGGATIFMRGILAAYGIKDRIVWAADSFMGVPPPTYPQDAGLDLSAKSLPVIAVSLEKVKELFARYDLLDDQARFIEGWFKDTLAVAPIERLSVLRLDGDLYESTMDALKPLYGKVSRGGFIIVDDYFSCPPCQHAVDEFRAMHGIKDALVRIDDQSLYWRKSSEISGTATA